MAWLRGAVSLLPVVGPAVDIVDSAAQGDHIGVAVELCGLVLDICSAGGGPRSAWKAVQASKAAARGAAVRAGAAAGKRAAIGAAASRVAGIVSSNASGARHVLKAHLKQRVKVRARRVVVKVGLAAAGLLAEGSGRRRATAAPEPASEAAQGCLSLAALRAQFLGGPQPSVAAVEPLTFALQSSADAQLHAAFANAAYTPPEQRRGVAALLDGGAEGFGAATCWYAYVGGDDYRGFWYSPGPRHLVLAERGTTPSDSDDWQRDACIAAGSGLAATSGRARASKAALLRQVQSHDCGRITLTGHSLGGAVAAFAACTVPRNLHVDAAHVFNPGGLPDLTRYLSCKLAASDIVVHRICGDPVSVAFLPFRQTQYARKCGHEEVDSHRLTHFL